MTTLVVPAKLRHQIAAVSTCACRSAVARRCYFAIKRRRRIDSGAACVAGWRMRESGLDSKQVLFDCYRAVKPGGRIIHVNHPCSEQGVAAAIERWAGQS